MYWKDLYQQRTVVHLYRAWFIGFLNNTIQIQMYLWLGWGAFLKQCIHWRLSVSEVIEEEEGCGVGRGGVLEAALCIENNICFSSM
jgi:hypothetical protein